jgi:hypothetical protein
MTSTKKIAILQSNYIPWKGYFDLINMVDEFILYDDMQYTKNDWRNRNRIKTPSGVQWLTIPVNNSLGQVIKDTKIANSHWCKKHWLSLKHNYNQAKYFNQYENLFSELYLRNEDLFLSNINYKFIKAICDVLNIETKLSLSMEYTLVEGKTERLLDLCKQAQATEYISGPSAKEYLQEDMFSQEGIKLIYMDYSDYPEYEQLFPPFEHGVSIIDLLFNEGDNSTKYMKSFI